MKKTNIAMIVALLMSFVAARAWFDETKSATVGSEGGSLSIELTPPTDAINTNETYHVLITNYDDIAVSIELDAGRSTYFVSDQSVEPDHELSVTNGWDWATIYLWGLPAGSYDVTLWGPTTGTYTFSVYSFGY